MECRALVALPGLWAGIGRGQRDLCPVSVAGAPCTGASAVPGGLGAVARCAAGPMERIGPTGQAVPQGLRMIPSERDLL